MTQNKNTYVCFAKGEAKVNLFSCTNIMHVNLHNGGGSHIESSCVRTSLLCSGFSHFYLENAVCMRKM